MPCQGILEESVIAAAVIAAGQICYRADLLLSRQAESFEVVLLTRHQERR